MYVHVIVSTLTDFLVLLGEMFGNFLIKFSSNTQKKAEIGEGTLFVSVFVGAVVFVKTDIII